MSQLVAQAYRPTHDPETSDEGALNVVVVNDSAHTNGGTARVAIDEACRLATRGHHVTFLAGFGPVEKMLAEAGVRVVLTGQSEITKDRVPARALLTGLRNLSAERAMTRVLQGLSNQHTIVHLHGWTKCLSASVIRPAVSRQFPIVCTLHDYFAVCPNGGLYDYGRQSACPLKPMSWACIARNCDKRNYLQKLYRVTRHWTHQYWHGMPDELRNFVAVSPFSRDLLGPNLPTEATIFDLPNPIDVEKRRPSEPERAAQFMFVGRLSPEKGPSLLARAAAGSDLPVTFVGDGPERSGIAEFMPSAEITGWLQPAQVIQRLQSCRALVYPSVCYETQGIAVQEAAAHGIPAVVADSCAAREAVIDGVTGLWFRGGDITDLQEKLARMADDTLVKRMGKAAYDRFWRAPMTSGLHAAALEQIYRQVLQRVAAGKTPEGASNVSASVAGISE